MIDSPPQALTSLQNLRHFQARIALGEELFNAVRSAKILVIGAGGIGSELLKNLVLSGFHAIHLVDLDTIEISNLNRQFLFRKQHVGSSKAIIARESVLQFNPTVNIISYQDNVKNTAVFNTEFMLQFDLVFSALDNEDARRYLNLLCFSANLPLIESGTSGYAGQAYSVLHGLTECKGCLKPQEQVTFAMCTVRNTPEKPEHCIAWSKNVFGILFDQPDSAAAATGDDFKIDDTILNNVNAKVQNGEESSMSINAKDATYNASEVASLRDIKLALAIKDLPDYNAITEKIDIAENQANLNKFFLYQAYTYFYYYYIAEICNQRTNTERWAKRQLPEMLSLPDLATVQLFDATFGDVIRPLAHSKTITNIYEYATEQQQKVLSTHHYSIQFIITLKDLFVRQFHFKQEFFNTSQKNNMFFNFDKDDTLAMSFISSSANLRMMVHQIAMISEFACKGIAGNIIHAIATTNAIAGGIMISQALFLMQRKAVGLLDFQGALATAEEKARLVKIVHEDLSSASIAVNLIVAVPSESQSLECFCSKPPILTVLKKGTSGVNLFETVTTQQMMLATELATAVVAKLATDETGGIEDFTWDVLSGTQNTLGSRDDLFMFKVKTQNTDEMDGNDGNSDEADDFSDDEEINEVIFKTLAANNIGHGAIVHAYQVLDHHHLVLKLYDESIFSNQNITVKDELYKISFNQQKMAALHAIMAQSSVLTRFIKSVEVSLKENTGIESKNAASIEQTALYRVTLNLHNNGSILFYFNLHHITTYRFRLNAHRDAALNAAEKELDALKQTKVNARLHALGEQDRSMSLLSDDEEGDDGAQKRQKFNNLVKNTADDELVCIDEDIVVAPVAAAAPAPAPQLDDGTIELD